MWISGIDNMLQKFLKYIQNFTESKDLWNIKDMLFDFFVSGGLILFFLKSLG